MRVPLSWLRDFAPVAGDAASIAATDVTVTDGSTTEVYKGAFSIKAPLCREGTPP